MIETYYGTVKFFSPRGFGFIHRTNDGEEFYFHITEVLSGDPNDKTRAIAPNTLVEFSLGKFKKEIVAKNVRPLASEVGVGDAE